MTDPKSHDDYYRVGYSVGPLSGTYCWGCPMMGWKCRNQSVPPCREHGKYHHQYLRQVKMWKEVV